jgi:hypothetical protein
MVGAGIRGLVLGLMTILVALAFVLLLANNRLSLATPGTAERVSVDNAGSEGNEWSRYPAISADGRYVAFESSASNLVMGDTNGSDDVFVHDRAGVSTAPPPPPTPTPTSFPSPTPVATPTAPPPPTVTPAPSATPEPSPTAVPPLTVTVTPLPPPAIRCSEPEFDRFEMPSIPSWSPHGMHTEPNIYCGTVTIDGQPAPDGTLVEAVAEGELCASVETQGGLYKLVVPLFLCPQNGGHEIVFLVAGREAKEKGRLQSPIYSWSLDLTVGVAPTPVKTPAMLPFTGAGEPAASSSGLPLWAMALAGMAAISVAALSAGAWYVRRRRAR